MEYIASLAIEAVAKVPRCQVTVYAYSRTITKDLDRIAYARGRPAVQDAQHVCVRVSPLQRGHPGLGAT
eukprot:scaffold71511_cov32-Tisochrysis_lutea.AAC.4